MRRVNTASTISQRDAYKLMLKDYPDVMSIEQMCEILSISTKTGYRILREGKICCLKVGRAIVFRRLIFSHFSASVAEKQSRRNAWTQFVYKKCSAEVLQFEPGSGIIEARYQVGVSATKKEVNYGSRTSREKSDITTPC